MREYFLREIGYWKIWIFADIVYKKTGPVSVHDLHHVTALVRPSLRISGEPPRSVLLRQHCRVRSLRWKWGVSPRQNCLKDNWASHLVSTEVIYVGAIFGVGKGNLISLDALLEACHLFSGVHWRAVAQLTSLIFCIVLSILTREQPMAHRIIKTFFSLYSKVPLPSPHSIHRQPFISHLSQTVSPNS